MAQPPPSNAQGAGAADDAPVAGAQAFGNSEERHHAAAVIQRTFRGHRTRRAMDGLTLDPSSRWVEAIKEAKYRQLIRARSRSDEPPSIPTSPGAPKTFAQTEWQRLREVARRAGNDDTSDTDGDEGMTPEQRAAYKQKRTAAKHKREIDAKPMGIEYFLEMMDSKHRYGSHLRAYHAAWKQTDTHENFFYWLDHGAGREVEVPTCSRERLERDQVRYLTREERYKYLVHIDREGRLRYAKNGMRVNTSSQFRDSIEGIVPFDDPTPPFRGEERGLTQGRQRRPSGVEDTNLSSASSDADSVGSGKEGEHYVNSDLNEARGVKKVQYISAAALMNHLLASTTKKNTWIFVADTSFRVYIGIKQSGAFQHSSFLQGSRVSAAGVIKVKEGQIRSLSPLSGHYRPPTRNFRAFVKTLKESGADLSRVSISKSYAVLLGVEGYMKTKKRAKDSIKTLGHTSDKLFRPEEARKREELLRDKSQSAAREREFLLKQREDRWEKSLAGQVTRRMNILSPTRSAVGSPTSPVSPLTLDGSVHPTGYPTGSKDKESSGYTTAGSTGNKEEKARESTIAERLNDAK